MDGNQQEALQAARWASARAAAMAHGQMKRGLGSLATIASTAAWIGVFGTLIGIVNSFPGMGIDKRTGLAIISGLLGCSLVPTGLGLLVALIAFCSYKYLSATLQDFDLEMHTAALQIVNDLAIHFQTTGSTNFRRPDA